MLKDLKKAFYQTGKSATESIRQTSSNIPDKTAVTDNVNDDMENKMVQAIREKSPDLSDTEVKSITKIAGLYINGTAGVTEDMSQDDAMDVLMKNPYISGIASAYYDAVKDSFDSMSIKDKIKFLMNGAKMRNGNEDALEDMIRAVDENMTDDTKETLNTKLSELDLSMDDVSNILKLGLTNEDALKNGISAAFDTYETETGIHVVKLTDIGSNERTRQMFDMGKEAFPDLYEKAMDNKTAIPVESTIIHNTSNTRGYDGLEDIPSETESETDYDFSAGM